MQKPDHGIQTAIGLIRFIANEPAVAHYIQEADFTLDTIGHNHSEKHYASEQQIPEVEADDPVVRLFAKSFYLKQAGLTWKAFYATIETTLKPPSPGLWISHSTFSMHAAVFALTLLPNVKRITLPMRWFPDTLCHTLIGAIIRQTTSRHPNCRTPSLARVTSLTNSPPQPGFYLRFALEQTSPFVGLPLLQSLDMTHCTVVGDCITRSVSADRYSGSSTSMKAVAFHNLDTSGDDITKFLRQFPHLESFRVSGDAGGLSRSNNNYKLITTLGRTVGSHLTALSVVGGGLGRRRDFGRSFLRDFRALKRLELSLDMLWCAIPSSRARREPAQVRRSVEEAMERLSVARLPIDDFMPISVRGVSLVSRDSGHDEEALGVFAQYVATRSREGVVGLEEIHVSYRENAREGFKEQCFRLCGEVEEPDMVLHVYNAPATGSVWD